MTVGVTKPTVKARTRGCGPRPARWALCLVPLVVVLVTVLTLPATAPAASFSEKGTVFKDGFGKLDSGYWRVLHDADVSVGCVCGT